MSKPLRERLMNLCGYYWWPPKNDDPCIKGPQPRLITREQYKALMKLREGADTNGECSAGWNKD